MLKAFKQIVATQVYDEVNQRDCFVIRSWLKRLLNKNQILENNELAFSSASDALKHGYYLQDQKKLKKT